MIERTHEEPQWRYPVSNPRFEPGTSRIRTWATSVKGDEIGGTCSMYWDVASKYKILIWKSERKMLLGKRRRRKDNIVKDFNEIGTEHASAKCLICMKTRHCRCLTIRLTLWNMFTALPTYHLSQYSLLYVAWIPFILLVSEDIKSSNANLHTYRPASTFRFLHICWETVS